MFIYGAAGVQSCSDAVQVETTQDAMERERYLTRRPFSPDASHSRLCRGEQVYLIAPKVRLGPAAHPPDAALQKHAGLSGHCLVPGVPGAMPEHGSRAIWLCFSSALLVSRLGLCP